MRQFLAVMNIIYFISAASVHGLGYFDILQYSCNVTDIIFKFARSVTMNMCVLFKQTYHVHFNRKYQINLN